MLLLAPKILRDILGNLPTIIFKSVNIKEILLEAGPFIIGFTKGKLTQSNNNKLTSSIPQNLTIQDKLLPKENDLIGSIILELYFNQFLNSEGLVLDIRARYFSSINNQVYWSPNNTWYQFQESFRLGLINLYTGFYTDNDSLYSKGLSELGLSTGLSAKKEEELKKLFNNHFGSTQTEVSFSTEAFNSSFSELFSFFIANEVEIKTDFIFLGIYLVTLYQTMEEIGGTHNVKEIFQKSFLSE
jgi:hypothetical protein